MAYLLNIRTMSMRLDSKDWRQISKIMLSLIAESLKNKLASNEIDMESEGENQFTA